ncbi:MAG: potassium channel family protein [Chloroflexi bacterium]|nr:potassium channel family protein [Chloroflexota bacterium]MCY3937990.1 potassium channel family protein [Chloroflexota bacterium]
MNTSQDAAGTRVSQISPSARLQQSQDTANEESRFRRRILASVGFITFNALGATIAYQIVEGSSLLDSLSMVAITLTTVGFGEVYPLSLAGRILTLGLVVFGVGGAIYALAAIAEYVAEGQFAAGIRRRRLRRVISKLSGHNIVCGFGRMGRLVAVGSPRDLDNFAGAQPETAN